MHCQPLRLPGPVSSWFSGWPRLGLIIAVVSSLLPAAVAAQSCRTLIPPCPPDQPPRVTLSLTSPDTFTTDTVRLTIYASDDHALSFSTWHLTVAGATA